MTTNAINAANEVATLGDGSIIILHKVLKENDRMKSEMAARRQGMEQAASDPAIAINLDMVVSVQEDFCNQGTILIDRNKSITLVREPFADVVEAWANYKSTASL